MDKGVLDVGVAVDGIIRVEFDKQTASEKEVLYTVIESYQKLQIKQLEIDFLMLFAAVGAAVLGNWAEGALLLFLFSISHSLEHYAMGRARRAIEPFLNWYPRQRSSGEMEPRKVCTLTI